MSLTCVQDEWSWFTQHPLRTAKPIHFPDFIPFAQQDLRSWVLPGLDGICNFSAPVHTLSPIPPSGLEGNSWIWRDGLVPYAPRCLWWIWLLSGDCSCSTPLPSPPLFQMYPEHPSWKPDTELSTEDARVNKTQTLTSRTPRPADIPPGPVVKTLFSNARGCRFNPWSGNCDLACFKLKSPNKKQKQYCNKFNKDLKKKPLQDQEASKDSLHNCGPCVLGILTRGLQKGQGDSGLLEKFSFCLPTLRVTHPIAEGQLC